MEKILVISTMYPGRRSQSFGIFVKNQVEALKQRGMAVDVASITDPRASKPILVKKYGLWLIQLIWIILTRAKQYDVIHAHYTFPSGAIALMFKKRCNTRVFVTAHGGDIDKMAQKGPFFFRMTKRVLHKADQVIAVGEQLRQDMVSKFGLNGSRIKLLNMGVNREVFRPICQEYARDEQHIPRDAFVLLYAGNLIKAKGLEELISAYSELKKTYANLELHLIGTKKELAFAKHIDNKIAAEQITDVTIHPPMNQQKLARWMAAADVFVIPSYMEGFGLVALEAMSCHTPVVGTRVGGLRYLLANDQGILVEPKNIAALQNGIASVIGSKDIRHNLITKGEEKAQQYDQNRLTEELIKLYQQE